MYRELQKINIQKGKQGNIYSEIKDSHFGDFLKYLKYKKLKIQTEDCIMNTKEQGIPS